MIGMSAIQPHFNEYIMRMTPSLRGTAQRWTPRHTFYWTLLTTLSLLEPSSTPSSMSSLVEKLRDLSAHPRRCTATVVFWTRSLTFPHVSDRSLRKIVSLITRPEVFSDGFSEGQVTDINEGFPSDAVPRTEYCDYLSDSDLEDEDSYSEDEEKPHEGGDTKGLPEEDDPEPPGGPHDSNSLIPPTAISEDPPHPSRVKSEGGDVHQLAPNSTRPPNRPS